MNAPTDVQIINDADGNPAFVVIPYAQYVAQKVEPDLIPPRSGQSYRRRGDTDSRLA